MVTCLVCGVELPADQADILGNGYRCAPCGMKKELAVGRNADHDLLDHHTTDELAALARGELLTGLGLLAAASGSAVAAVFIRHSAQGIVIAGAAAVSVTPPPLITERTGLPVRHGPRGPWEHVLPATTHPQGCEQPGARGACGPTGCQRGCRVASAR